MTRPLSDLLLSSCERCGDPIDFVADSVEPRLCGTCAARMAWKQAKIDVVARRAPIEAEVRAPASWLWLALGLLLGVVILGAGLLAMALLRGLGAPDLPF